jgi:hypothetical protein
LASLSLDCSQREVPASDFQLRDELRLKISFEESSDISLAQADEESENNDDDVCITKKTNDEAEIST